MRYLTLLLLVLCGSSLAKRKSNLEGCELCDFVYSDHDSVEPSAVDMDMVQDLGPRSSVITYLVNMTSLNWTNDAFRTIKSVWSHHVVVNIPKNLTKSTAFLAFVGMRDSERFNLSTKRHIGVLAYVANLARATEAVTVLVFNVPKEPITFVHNGEETEPYDSYQSMAYTAMMFKQNQKANTTLVAAMVKVAIRAMDFVQSYVSYRGKRFEVEKFVLYGAAKRAWPVWLSAAIDDRVAGIIPIMSNFLNFQQMINHTYRSLGGHFPVFAKAWKEMTGFRFMGEPYMKNYTRITDPYEYIQHIDVPKLIILASEDDLFPVDNLDLFYHKLIGKKHLLIVPNVGHELAYQEKRFLHGLVSLQVYFHDLLNNIAMPDITWSKETKVKNGKLRGTLKVNVTLKNGNKKWNGGAPRKVFVYHARSRVPGRRDFRERISCPNCEQNNNCDTCRIYDASIWQKEENLQTQPATGQIGDTNYWNYTIVLDELDGGYYRQFYLKIKSFGGLMLSSGTMMLPDTFPVSECCTGQACARAGLV